MLSNDFEFPFTFGAVDGSHIHIKAPLANLTDYTNRKSFTSVVLQAVCDGRMQFLDISTGWPGSMHDARIFRLSSLSTSLRTSSSMFHILGDSAYALTNHVIVPFKDNGHLTPDEVHFQHPALVVPHHHRALFRTTEGQIQASQVPGHGEHVTHYSSHYSCLCSPQLHNNV